MAPSYISLFHSGELRRRAQIALAMQSPCRLCPRGCGVIRAEGEKGFCDSGVVAKVFRHAPHFGEEPPLVGMRGSGTVFFSGCTLRCAYCQNHRFSQEGEGVEVRAESLAGMFLGLKRAGCHNINMVTATHFLPQVLAALEIAAEEGLDIPLVYNTSGYEAIGTLQLLEGIVDIYLPDMRYSSPDVAAKYSLAGDYPEFNRRAVLEMQHQVGNLLIDEKGIAIRGLIVRHLVLPGGLSGTRDICEFLASRVSPDVAVSLMSQYAPCHQASGDLILGRRVTEEEFCEARACLDEYGLENGWVQEWSEEEAGGSYMGTFMECNVH